MESKTSKSMYKCHYVAVEIVRAYFFNTINLHDKKTRKKWLF